jgi:Family of unknown function (DUF6788)
MAANLAQLRRRHQALAARIGQIGFAVSGSLIRRYTTCGKPGCHCQADPPRPHGPYYQLTRKVAGKTVTTRLTAGQAARYAEWIANQRELRRLIAEMEQISRQAAGLILSESPETGKTPGDQPA